MLSFAYKYCNLNGKLSRQKEYILLERSDIVLIDDDCIRNSFLTETSRNIPIDDIVMKEFSKDYYDHAEPLVM